MVRTITKPFLVLNEIDFLPPLFRQHIRPRKACRENTLTIIYKYKAQRILRCYNQSNKKSGGAGSRTPVRKGSPAHIYMFSY